jgi:hypothetical protein
MKQFSVKNFYIFFSSVFIFLMHLPFNNAKGKPAEGIKIPVKKEAPYLPKDSITLPESVIAPNILQGIYDSLRLNVMGLSKQAFQYAVQGLEYLVQNGKLANEKIISIVDFSLPSSKKRLFVIDLDNKKILFNTYVAHGMNSGKEFANQFSNYPASNKSSLGFYETATTYMGKNGYSLHLQGLEKGINDNATRRDIVIHGAEYVNEGYVQMQGYIGRSQGCPAVPEKLHRPIIDKIKNGTCLFIYSADKHYFIHSRILKEAGLMALENNN